MSAFEKLVPLSVSRRESSTGEGEPENVSSSKSPLSRAESRTEKSSSRFASLREEGRKGRRKWRRRIRGEEEEEEEEEDKRRGGGGGR